MLNARERFTTHRSRCSDTNPRYDAAGCRIEFKLTYGEWYDIWDASGKWSERGVGAGKYCMTRLNDLGHYEVGNVEIRLHTTNSIDASIGRSFTHTEEAKRKISEAGKGRKASAETVAKMSKAATGVICKPETKAKLSALWKGKQKNRVTCKLCGMETSPQNLSRHTNVCK